MTMHDNTRQLIDLILDDFSKNHEFAIGIFERGGKHIFSSNAKKYFSPLCKYLHSKPQFREVCDSDHEKRGSMRLSEPRLDQCVWGLHNVAYPIVIDGESQGTILCGQKLVPGEGEDAEAMLNRCFDKCSPSLRRFKGAAIRKLRQVDPVDPRYFKKVYADLDGRILQLVFHVYFERKMLDYEKSDLERRTSNVAHEIQIYNQGALAAAERLNVMLLRLQSEEQITGLSKKIAGMLVHLGSVVTNMLWASTRFHYDFQVADLLDSLRDTLVYYAWYAKARNIDIKFTIGRGSPKMRCSRIHVDQVFNNLIHNAIKYSYFGNETAGRTRYIQVKSESTGGYYKVDFINYGIPIGPDETSRIYEKYTRGKHVLDEMRTGTGLGLSIVKDVMDAHEGTVDFKSIPQSGGANLNIFSVLFPYS